MATQLANLVGAYEAKTHFSALLEKVEAGEEVTITKHGTPVARLVPIKKQTTQAERRAAMTAASSAIVGSALMPIPDGTRPPRRSRRPR